MFTLETLIILRAMSSLISRFGGIALSLVANIGFTVMDTTAQSCIRLGSGPFQVVFDSTAW